MTDIRIRSFEVASHKLDNDAPPSFGTINVEVGGIPMRLYLQQAQVDAMVAAAEPIMFAVLEDVRGAMNAKPQIVA